MLRCEKGFEKMLGQLAQGGGAFTVGMIVHGGTIMSLLSRFHGGEYFDYQVPNGAGYVCVLKRDCGELKITECRKLELGEAKPVGAEAVETEPGNGENTDVN